MRVGMRRRRSRTLPKAKEINRRLTVDGVPVRVGYLDDGSIGYEFRFRGQDRRALVMGWRDSPRRFVREMRDEAAKEIARMRGGE